MFGVVIASVCVLLEPFWSGLDDFWYVMFTRHWEKREGWSLSGSTVMMARTQGLINSTKMFHSLQNCRQRTYRWSSFLFVTPKVPRFIFIAPKTLNFQPMFCCFPFLPMRCPALWDIWLRGDLNSSSMIAQWSFNGHLAYTSSWQFTPQPGMGTLSCKPNGNGIPASNLTGHGGKTVWLTASKLKSFYFDTVSQTVFLPFPVKFDVGIPSPLGLQDTVPIPGWGRIVTMTHTPSGRWTTVELEFKSPVNHMSQSTGQHIGRTRKQQSISWKSSVFGAMKRNLGTFRVTNRKLDHRQVRWRQFWSDWSIFVEFFELQARAIVTVDPEGDQPSLSS